MYASKNYKIQVAEHSLVQDSTDMCYKHAIKCSMFVNHN
jgi:sRNA-binding regulator protein Hfq